MIFQPQADDLAGSQPARVENFQQGAIAQAERRLRQLNSKQAIDFLLAQHLGQQAVEARQVKRRHQVVADDALALEVGEEMAQRDDDDLHRRRREVLFRPLKAQVAAQVLLHDQARLEARMVCIHPLRE